MKVFILLLSVSIVSVYSGLSQSIDLVNDWKLIEEYSDEFTYGFDADKWKKIKGYHGSVYNELQYTTLENENLNFTGGRLIITSYYESIAFQEELPSYDYGIENLNFFDDGEIHFDDNVTDYESGGHSASAGPDNIPDGKYEDYTDLLGNLYRGEWYRDFNYTSGCVYSNAKHQHGYFEIKCRLPVGSGVWPAFWLYGSSKVPIWYDEIDIFEAYGKPYKVQINYWDEYIGGAFPNNDAISLDVDLVTDMHTYGVEWSKNKMIFYYDGVAKYTEISDNVPEHPIQIILNLSIKKDELVGTIPKAEFDIEYVRVYKEKLQLNSSTIYYPVSELYEGVYSINLANENYYIVDGDGFKGGKLECLARNNIKLKPGFKVQKGGEFTAKIGKLDIEPSKKSGEIKFNGINSDQMGSTDTLIYKNKVLSYDGFNIYPNPNKGLFIIDSKSLDANGIIANIYNSSGEKVKELTLNNSQTQINLLDQPNGIYMIHIYNKVDIYISKIVKQ